MKAALYARVSKKDRKQDTENQLAQLREYAGRMGLESIEYVDRVTGSGDKERPQFDRMMGDARNRQFDLVLFWSLDRFTREGALKTLQHLERLSGYGVGWRSHVEQYLDSTGVFRDAVIAIVATIAKQERVRIVERTMAGLERARAKGKKFGRPRKVVDIEKVKRLRAEGLSLVKVAALTGVSRATVDRVAARP